MEVSEVVQSDVFCSNPPGYAAQCPRERHGIEVLPELVGEDQIVVHVGRPEDKAALHLPDLVLA